MKRDFESAGSASGHDAFPQIASLTPTQLKVMRGVHSGLLNKQIAHDLGIAEATVKAHMTALMRKLKLRNRTQVALAAQRVAWPLAISEAARPGQVM